MGKIETTPAYNHDTLMFAEAAESGAAVRRQLLSNADQFARIGIYLRSNPPKTVITIGRGSSDHAAVYAKYLIETRQGVITSHAGPSVNSIYGMTLGARNTMCLAISQSGQSPDLVSAVKGIRNAGAHIFALINAENSPLCAAADETIPLCAGPELSVAATKSFITALTAIAQIVAHWGNDHELLAAIEQLPDHLDEAWALDWSPVGEALVDARNLFVLGRGVGYGVAREAALKLKETCSLHAEAYSAAEVLHGPAALVEKGFPILAFTQNDKTKNSLIETLSTLASRGARVFATGVDHPAIVKLPSLNVHPALQPILMVQSFYRMVNSLSIARGLDPDSPPNLSKVTLTL